MSKRCLGCMGIINDQDTVCSKCGYVEGTLAKEAYHLPPGCVLRKILDTFSIATKKTEICDVNIQVYYWLNLKEKPRVAVPSEYNMAIVGWLGRNDFSGKAFVQYATEEREVADIKLRQLRAMDTLLEYLE